MSGGGRATGHKTAHAAVPGPFTDRERAIKYLLDVSGEKPIEIKLPCRRLHILLERLEALAVDNARARLVILVLGDPHLLEGGQRGEDGASNPDRVLALRRRHNLNLDGRRGKGRHLLRETLVDVLEHGGASGQHSVGVQVTTDIDVALLDGVVGQLVDARGLLSEEGRLEQGLGATESLSADGDNLAVGKLVVLLQIL